MCCIQAMKYRFHILNCLLIFGGGEPRVREPELKKDTYSQEMLKTTYLHVLNLLHMLTDMYAWVGEFGKCFIIFCVYCKKKKDGNKNLSIKMRLLYTFSGIVHAFIA